MKFYENPFSGSRVFPCGRTEGQTRRSYVEASRNFAKEPKMRYVQALCLKKITVLHKTCKTSQINTVVKITKLLKLKPRDV